MEENNRFFMLGKVVWAIIIFIISVGRYGSTPIIREVFKGVFVRYDSQRVPGR